MVAWDGAELVRTPVEREKDLLKKLSGCCSNAAVRAVGLLSEANLRTKAKAQHGHSSPPNQVILNHSL